MQLYATNGGWRPRMRRTGGVCPILAPHLQVATAPRQRPGPIKLASDIIPGSEPRCDAVPGMSEVQLNP